MKLLITLTITCIILFVITNDTKQTVDKVYSIQIKNGEKRSMTHHTESGFSNPEIGSRNTGFKDFLRWRKERSKNHPTYESALNTFPVVQPDWENIYKPPNDSLTVTWIGHATLLVQFDGMNILTDPIFSDRCSPVQFIGPKRYTPLSITTKQLPTIHVVLISHNHYDSLDEHTVKAIGNDPIWFVPLGLKKWFQSHGITNVIELDWWSEYEYKGFKFVSTPTQHFSGRGLFDRNKTLWCSWVVFGKKHRFWFAGDTGYFSEFKKIGEKYGPFDLAAIPIGAYNPEWFMLPMHINPQQAVHVHQDIGSKQSIAIHWGTFILTDEPVDEPPRLLQIAMQDTGLNQESFTVLKHGETIIYP